VFFSEHAVCFLHCQAEDEMSAVFVPKNKMQDDSSVRITKCVQLSILNVFCG